METTKYLVVIKKELWLKFKSKCVTQDKSIKDVFVELILKYLED